MKDENGTASSLGLVRRAFDYIERIQGVRDAAAVIAGMEGFLDEVGIDYFSFWFPANTPAALRKSVLTDRPHYDWMESLFARGQAARNPVMNGDLGKNGPLAWSEMVRMPRVADKLMPVYRGAQEFGINEGLCFSIQHRRRPNISAVFYGRHLDISAEARSSLQVLALFTHERLARLGAWPQGAGTVLTQREADCLAWVARGKTDWEISEILSISENTVHWYIEQAKRKLGVPTRVQAVVAAIHDRAITV
jgi:LuxR family transcriptional regulator, quorum-sensing system regulator BjaR1